MFSLSRPLEKAHEIRGFPLRALAWSLGLHALVIAALTGLPPNDRLGLPPTLPLRAALRPLPHQDAIAVVPDPVRPMTTPVALAPPPAQRVPVSPPPAVMRELTFGAPPAPPHDAEPEHAVPDAAGLRQYRLALAGAARRVRDYPEAARRDGLEGTAEIRIWVSRGAWRDAALAQTSGHALLDAAALAMLKAAAADAPLPASLRGAEFTLLLPVVFSAAD